MKKVIGCTAVSLLALMGIQAKSSRISSIEDFELEPTLERVRFTPAPSTLMTVVGVDWVDGRPYLLDAIRAEVVVLEERASGWVEAFAFGGEGDGPGEFRAPMDVLWLPGSEEIVVLTMAARAHYFSASGRFLRSETLTLPCTFGKRSLTLRSADDFWISGNCVPDTAAGDTVFAAVEGRDAIGAWRVAAKVPRFTLDGSYGTPFGIQNPTVAGPGVTFLTGGNDLCFLLVPGRGHEALARELVPDRRCFSGSFYSSPAPADHPPPPTRFGPLFAWPEPLPAVSEAAVVGGGLAVVRMYSADSVFVERHDFNDRETGGSMLAGGPFHGLVGCRSHGCLWFEPGRDSNRLGILRFSDLLPPTKGAARAP